MQTRFFLPNSSYIFTELALGFGLSPFEVLLEFNYCGSVDRVRASTFVPCRGLDAQGCFRTPGIDADLTRASEQSSQERTKPFPLPNFARSALHLSRIGAEGLRGGVCEGKCH